MTDAVQIALIVSFGPTLVGLAGAWVSWRNGKQLKSVHTLVNSGAIEQLRVGMISAKALATASPTPENAELARVAEDKYNQAIKNAKPTG